MAWFKRFFQEILNWLLGRPRPLRTKYSDEIPDALKAKTVYIIGEGNYRWYAVMLCPGGCGTVLHMNLMPDSRPRWSLTEHGDGTISLHPSVWRKTGCQCHFWLKRGKVEWCDMGRCKLALSTNAS